MTETTKPSRHDNRTKKIILIAGGVILIVIAILLGLRACDSHSGGATLGTYDNKSREEIMAELDEKAKKSLMEISLDITPELSSDKKQLEVRVQNSKKNHFNQSVTVMQNDKEVGFYDCIKPGEKLDTIDVHNMTDGDAKIVIKALDPETNKPHGSASEFEVTVHNAE